MTLAGFQGAFYAEHKRAATAQEIFDAGIVEGKRRLGEQLEAEAKTKEPWPMLETFHLEAIIFAYNEGFSKAYDRRVFPNPFTLVGSQARAYELGVRDGTEVRDRDDETEKRRGKK